MHSFQVLFFFLHLTILSRSQLTFTSISMQNIQNETVAIYADGLVTNTGSISATITQSSSLSVYYQNMHLAYLYE